MFISQWHRKENYVTSCMQTLHQAVSSGKMRSIIGSRSVIMARDAGMPIKSINFNALLKVVEKLFQSSPYRMG